MRHKIDSMRQSIRHLMVIMQLGCTITLTVVLMSSHSDITGRVVRILDGDTLEVRRITANVHVSG